MRHVLVLTLMGCAGADDEGGPTDAPPDTDTGSIVSSGPLFDDGHVLVMPLATGVDLVGSDGSVVFSRTWADLVGSCGQCGGEGASADGDGLLLSFTTDGQNAGGIARVDADASLDFRVDGFDFPHDAVRDPLDGTIIVPESTGGVITWVDEDGQTVRALDDADPAWIGDTPNGIDRFDWEGRSLLLSSHRGAGGVPGPGPSNAAGEISLWDISSERPELLWVFPQDGDLDTPHGPVFREHDGRMWLLWAHTEGAAEGGSVGLAVTDDPTVRPEYVADLVPTADVAPFTFLRGVELTSDGWLLLTDSGQGRSSTGRLLRAPFPDGLDATGATGAVDADQVLVDLEGAEVLASGLANPFEGWLWEPTFPLD